MALITPSKSHPEVIIQAVSARDKKKAQEFAKANSIPEVRDSYEGMSIFYLSLSLSISLSNNSRHSQRPQHRLRVHSAPERAPL